MANNPKIWEFFGHTEEQAAKFKEQELVQPNKIIVSDMIDVTDFQNLSEFDTKMIWPYRTLLNKTEVDAINNNCKNYYFPNFIDFNPTRINYSEIFVPLTIEK